MDIQFARIDDEAGIFRYDLDRFASAFGHSVTRVFPIWTAHINGRLAGYGHMHPHMMLYPAISPWISPREFYQLAWTWFSQIKQAYGDPLVAVSQPDKEKLFRKIGLAPFDKQVYLIRD